MLSIHLPSQVMLDAVLPFLPSQVMLDGPFSSHA